MKKLVIFLAVAAMIIAPVVGFSQLTKQNYDQLRILKEGIQAKKEIVKQLQEKILYISQLNSEINNLKLIDSLYSLPKNQSERLNVCLFELKKFLINNPNLEERLEEERIKQEELEAKKEAIMMYAATNRDTPEEPDYFQGRRLKKGLELKDLALNIKAKESKVNFDNKVRELTLKKLEDSDNSAPFTLVLVNYSQINNRQFVVTNTITGKVNSYIVSPKETLELNVFPGKYLCDIVDMNSGRTRKNNIANIGVDVHTINNKKVNGFFYAPKYF